MSALASAVRFRALIAQFRRNERDQFITTFVRSNQDFVLTALFTHFRLNRNDNMMQQISTTVSSIISAREDEPKARADDDEAVPITINALSTHSLGYIASFLPQTDYFSLGQASRFMFNACNSPNKLVHLDLTLAEDLEVNLTHFRSVQHLSINLAILCETDVPNSSIMRHLTKLTLNNEGMGHIDQGTLERLMSIVSTNSLKHLVLTEFGNSVASPDGRFSLTRLLRNFPMIEHLALYKCRCDIGNLDVESALLPKLQCLMMSGGSVATGNWLISTFGPQLHSLMFQSSYYPTLQSISFSKLRQLYLWKPLFSFLKTISQSTHLIENLGLSIKQNQQFQPEEMAEAMESIFVNQTALKRLRIRCFSDRAMLIFNSLIAVHARNKDTDSFNVEIAVDCIDAMTLDRYLQSALRLTVFLKSAFAHFMLKIEFRGESKPNVAAGLPSSLAKTDRFTAGLRIYGVRDALVLTNIGCTLRDHDAGWRCIIGDGRRWCGW